MMTITKNREIRASVDEVWQKLVDWENERKYWSNERDIKILSSEDNTIVREATVGPRGFVQKTVQKIALDQKKTIKLSLQGDHITGERTINLVPITANQTRVDVSWDLELSSVPGFVEGIVKNQIAKVTEDALNKIASSLESETS